MDVINGSGDAMDTGESAVERRSKLDVNLRKRTHENARCRRHPSNNSTLTPTQEPQLDTTAPAMQKLINEALLPDPESKLKALKQIRRLTSLDDDVDSTFDRLISLGVLPILIENMKPSTQLFHASIQLEAAWALTNLASGSSGVTQKVVSSGAVPVLNDLICTVMQPNCDFALVEQALWAIGNLMGDNPELRNQLLSLGVFDCILRICQSNVPVHNDVLRMLSWVLINVVRRGDPLIPDAYVPMVLGILKGLLVTQTDAKILTNVLLAYHEMCRSSSARTAIAIEDGLITNCMNMLENESTKVQSAALRVLGNLVSESDDQAQVVLNHGVLNSFLRLLCNPTKPTDILKETLWTISNIAAGTVAQVQMIIDAEILPQLVNLLQRKSYTIRKETIWVISNTAIQGTQEQICTLIEHHVVPLMCEFLLDSSDSEALLTALNGLYNILKKTPEEKYSGVCNMVEEKRGVSALEDLAEHDNEEVSEIAIRTLDKFFSESSEDSEESQE